LFCTLQRTVNYPDSSLAIFNKKLNLLSIQLVQFSGDREIKNINKDFYQKNNYDKNA